MMKTVKETKYKNDAKGKGECENKARDSQHQAFGKRINRILRKYGIVEQAYHGNCLIGAHCRRLMIYGKEILDEVRPMFLQFRS